MNRRYYLASTGVALTTAIAGCSGSGSGDEQGDSSNDLQGPTSEDSEYVDVQYREYSADEVSQIKNNITDVSFEELFRNIESYTGDFVSFQGEILQNLEGDGYFTFLISFDQVGEELVYGSWVGGRYLEGDQIEFWAVVLGTETYETGFGSQKTVPALSIADIEQIE